MFIVQREVIVFGCDKFVPNLFVIDTGGGKREKATEQRHQDSTRHRLSAPGI